MKKLFLIPVLALFTCVSAWAETVPVQVATSEELTTALANADADVIQLTADIDDATSYTITRSLTLNLQNHTITQPTANSSLYVFEINASSIEVTIQNGAVVRESHLFDTNKGGNNIRITQAAQVTLNNMTAIGGYQTLVVNNTNCHIQIQGGLYRGVQRAITVNSGTIQIDGGTFEGAQIMQAYAKSGNINITVTDGIFHPSQYGFLLYGYEGNTVNMTLSGGEISNGTYGVYVAGNNSSADVNRASYPVSLTVTGGTIDGANGGIFLRGKGAEVNIQGGTVTGGYYAITGNGPDYDGGTTINISGGTVGSESTAYAIYHPQPGVLNITGGNLIGAETAIEIRAGELNISGNPTLTSLSTEKDCQPNGSGTTIIGAALAISQHTTTQPIAVTIDGGTFRGIYPIRQSNPQANAQQYVDLLTLTVNGGKFWATNTEKVAANSENNKLKFRGGYYNLAPHAFVANGYVAINNPDAAPNPTVADGYLFKVVPLEPETFESTTLTEGNWVVEDTWKENESVADHIPTQHTNVTIPDGGNVYVQPTPEEKEVVAYAHNLTLAGNATLKVKAGATLVLGNEATVANTANLVVEAGGQLLIAPSESEVHPVGSVTLIADAAGLKKEGLDDTIPNNLYWQHFAIPTTVAPTIRVEDKDGNEITTPITYYNTWDIVNGWENVLKTDMNTPFQGYNLSNDREYHSDIRYIFSGPLVGNASNPLVFARRGFSFFGNSYLAPINIRALQAAMYEQGMEYTVYVYVHRNASGPQIYRAINDVTAGIYGIEEIKPLEGFFMFAEEASRADFQYNSAVYSAFLNKQMGGQKVNNAPARNAKPAYDAKVVVAVEAQNGESDEVILVASENFSNDYDLKADARKMENSGMNIYADGSFDNLAVMATNDLMGQTLTFRAGKDALYTMTFSNVEGELALYDNEVNQTISIAEGSTYTFAAQPNSTVNGRFEIVKPAMLPTAIENTEVKANIKGIYSITGQYVGENFEAVPAGVYVVNGVKIVK